MAGIGIKQNPDEIASAGLYFIFTCGYVIKL